MPLGLIVPLIVVGAVIAVGLAGYLIEKSADSYESTRHQ